MSVKKNSTYFVRPSARRDLADVWLYTAERWSVEQADNYVAQLSATFALLAENPEIARLRKEYNSPVRMHRHMSHIIVYQDAKDGVEIIRIRHSSEDWMTDPANES